MPPIFLYFFFIFFNNIYINTRQRLKSARYSNLVEMSSVLFFIIMFLIYKNKEYYNRHVMILQLEA